MLKRMLVGILMIVLIILSTVTACSTSSTTSQTPLASTSTGTSTQPYGSTSTPQTSALPSSTTTSIPFVTSTTSAPAGTGNWWDTLGVPQYGGSINYQVASFMPGFDPYSAWSGQLSYYLDTLWVPNWKTDRNVWAFKTTFMPDDQWAGNLAQSWEMPDMQTVIVHLKQGVKWQDKAPVNGREFTADDVVQHYARLMGTGYGYTVPSGYMAARMALWDSITSTDKYTVVFKFKFPSALNFSTITEDSGQNYIEPPEWAKLGPPPGIGPASPELNDWKNAAGTGPWIITGMVSGATISYSKNPNYFGFDERYPQNRLPYADSFTINIIPDQSTAMAALRTGKIDFMPHVGWQQAQTLAQSNPELKQIDYPIPGQGINIRVDKAPFTDIRIRKAMQMAIDRKTIAKTYFGGVVDGTPCSLFNPVLADIGYGYPYKDWPQSLKDEYSYNLTAARELMTEAGFPHGFKTDLVALTTSDQGLMQIIKAEFMDIGIDMDIRLMDPVSGLAFAGAKKTDAMWWNGMGMTGIITSLNVGLTMFMPNEMANFGNVDDAGYKEIYYKWLNSTTESDLKKYTTEADKYAQEQHWTIKILPNIAYNITQPYLKGYSGEVVDQGGSGGGWIWSRLWVDQNAKKQMGR